MFFLEHGGRMVACRFPVIYDGYTPLPSARTANLYTLWHIWKFRLPPDGSVSDFRLKNPSNFYTYPIFTPFG